MLKSGEIVTIIWIWFRQHSASIISTYFLFHKSLKILSTSAFIRPLIIYLLYFNAKTIWYLHLHLLYNKLFKSFIDIDPPMLKCCGCQTNFILPLGVFSFSLRFFTDSQFNWELVMPIRRTMHKRSYWFLNNSVLIDYRTKRIDRNSTTIDFIG